MAANQNLEDRMTTSLNGSIENYLETFPCDNCGQTNEAFLFTKTGALTGYPFRVVRCCSCGLIYLNPRLNEQGIAELYDGEYYNGRGFDPFVNYVEELHKEQDLEKLFRPE